MFGQMIVINIKLLDGSSKKIDSKEQLDKLIMDQPNINTQSSSTETDFEASSSHLNVFAHNILVDYAHTRCALVTTHTTVVSLETR